MAEIVITVGFVVAIVAIYYINKRFEAEAIEDIVDSMDSERTEERGRIVDAIKVRDRVRRGDIPDRVRDFYFD